MMSIRIEKRIQSFAWRAGMMCVAVVITAAIEAFGAEMPPWVTIVLGLVAGEISKYINTK